MFFLTSKILAFLTKPILWVFAILIYTYIYKKKYLFTAIILFFIFSNEFIADEFTRIWQPINNYPTEIYDVGIVLGGISSYDKITQTHNFNKHNDRLMYAEELYHNGIIKKIMISGGNGLLFNNSYIESKSLKEYLIKNKIPKEDIIIETKSRNTKENAFNSARILKKQDKEGKYLLITSANHMRRAQICFEKTDIDIDNYSTDCINSNRNFSIPYLIIPSSKGMEKWEELIHEWIGFIAYKTVI